MYILCSDNSYYTGITNNLDRRINEHNEGISPSSYTYSRRPVKLVFQVEFNEVMQAILWEKRIKNWSRKKKEALINSDFDALVMFSKKSFNK